MINCTKCFYECLDRFSLFEQTGHTRSGKKPGKSGNSDITLPALESQGIPHVLFKIQEKCVNSVSSRQHQKNIRRRPDFCPAHFPVLTVHYHRFCGPILRGANLTDPHYGLSPLDISFQKHYGTSVILSRRVRLRDSVNHNCEAKNLVLKSKLFEP